MAEKNMIEINIFGHMYTIKSEKSKEYVQRIADNVDKKVSELRKENPKLKEIMLLNLALLYFSEENVEVEEKYKGLVKKSEVPMREYTNLLNKNDDMIKNINRLEEKNGQLQSSMEKCNKKSEEYIRDINILQREVEEKDREISQSKDTLENVRNEYIDSLSLINSLQKELEEIKGKVL